MAVDPPEVIENTLLERKEIGEEVGNISVPAVYLPYDKEI